MFINISSFNNVTASPMILCCSSFLLCSVIEKRDVKLPLMSEDHMGNPIDSEGLTNPNQEVAGVHSEDTLSITKTPWLQVRQSAE